MDTTTIMIVAVIGGISILGFILKVFLHKLFDKMVNERAIRKDAQRPHEMSRLADRDSASNLNTANNQRYN